MGAAPDERLKDSTEIQGNILAGFNKPHQLFLFLNFRHNRKGARAWLRRLTRDKRIAATKDVTAHNQKYRELRKEFGARRLREELRVRQEWMGVGLTSWGVVTLHPELAAELVAFDAYWRGPLSGGRGEQGPVGGLEPGAWCLATQHRELMAQDENLEVFRGVTAGEPHEQLHGAAHGKVREFR